MQMAEESKMKMKQKMGSISQEDIYSVLQRYSITTVLTLLREISHVADVKIDWNELVKSSTTGISSAREYQMLWRHLAYRDTLEGNLDKGTVPSDDDSDLEFEVEAYPPANSEALSEAAACVKVMFASGSLNDANPGSTVEAPLTINIPSGWSSTAASENLQLQEMNVTVPVLVQKQPMPATVTSIEACDANGSAGGPLPPRRKRKPWSKQEDDELIAAVHRYGEGNWANILKEELITERNASQLSQRWAIIRKRLDNVSVGGPQATDVQAFRRAVQLALDMPNNMTSSFYNGKGGTNSNTTTTTSFSTRPTAGESSQQGTQSQHHPQQDSDPMTSSKSRFLNSVKPSTGPTLCPNDAVKAAAVAAGARIATPSDAALLLKAAQSKNVHHVISSGPTSIKSPGSSNVKSLPPNVHYIRTGLLNRSTSGLKTVSTDASRPGGTHQAQNHITRPLQSTVQVSCTPDTNGSNLPIEKVPDEALDVSDNGLIEQVQKTVASVPENVQIDSTPDGNGFNPPKEKVRDEVIVVSGCVPMEQVKKSNASVSDTEIEENIPDEASVVHDEASDPPQGDQNALSGSKTHLHSESNYAENPRSTPTSQVEGQTDSTKVVAENGSERGEKFNKMILVAVDKERENKKTAEEIVGNLSSDGKPASYESEGTQG